MGNTENDFKSRLDTHNNAIKNNFPDVSALARHSLDNKNHFDFQNTYIMVSKIDQ